MMTFEEAALKVFAHEAGADDEAQVAFQRQHPFVEDIHACFLHDLLYTLANATEQAFLSTGYSRESINANLLVNGLSIGVSIGVLMERQELDPVEFPAKPTEGNRAKTGRFPSLFKALESLIRRS